LIAEGVFDVELPESDEDEIDTSSPSFDLYFFERTGSKLQAFIFPIEHFCHYYKNFSSIHQEPHSPSSRSGITTLHASCSDFYLQGFG
jgi:hypothetical protein